MMSLMIHTLGLPIEYLTLYILLDRVLDYPITAMNVWGDLIGARIIDEIEISSTQNSVLRIHKKTSNTHKLHTLNKEKTFIQTTNLIFNTLFLVGSMQIGAKAS